MDEKIIFREGETYYRIYVSKRVAMTQKAECWEIKRGQIVNETKILKKIDAWFPNYLQGGDMGFFLKTIGLQDAIYVHESLYKKLKFVFV